MTPTFAIVTPSFNQGAFLEAAIRSVLDQRYPHLEYAVVDGASSDNSPSIIEKYAGQLRYHVSEKDAGQYDAINKGFAHTSGEIMGWLNSDDMHCPWALSVVGEIFAQFPEVEWLTTAFPMRWDAAGRATHCTSARGYARGSFAKGENCPGCDGFYAAPIQQESTFWRRSLWKKAGGSLSQDFGSAGDYELWCRFMKHAELHAVTVPLAGFRRHGDQQTGRALQGYFEGAREAQSLHFPGAQSGSYRKMRPFARDRAPEFLRKALTSFGLLYPAKVITRSRDNSTWLQTQCLV